MDPIRIIRLEQRQGLYRFRVLHEKTNKTLKSCINNVKTYAFSSYGLTSRSREPLVMRNPHTEEARLEKANNNKGPAKNSWEHDRMRMHLEGCCFRHNIHKETKN
jgi:hypothetical protein